MKTITEQALIKRINRALAKQYESVRRCREDSRAFGYYGTYYVLDTWRNSPIATHVDLESLGRELGVLGQYEALCEQVAA